MHPFCQRFKQIGTFPNPVAQGRYIDLNAASLKYTLKPIERLVITVFAGENVSQKPFTGNSFINRHGGKLAYGDVAFTILAGIFGSHIDLNKKRGGNIVELFCLLCADKCLWLIVYIAELFFFRRLNRTDFASQVSRQRIPAFMILVFLFLVYRFRLGLLLLFYLRFDLIVEILKQQPLAGTERFGFLAE